MFCTLDQFRAEALKHPVVVKLDGIYIPIDVPMLIASLELSGVIVTQFCTFHYENHGVKFLVLTGVDWQPYLKHQNFKLNG